MAEKFLARVQLIKRLERTASFEAKGRNPVDLSALWSRELHEAVALEGRQETNQLVDILFKVLVEDLTAESHYAVCRIRKCLEALVDLIAFERLPPHRCQTQFLAIKQVSKPDYYTQMSAEMIRLLFERMAIECQTFDEARADKTATVLKKIADSVLKIYATESGLLPYAIERAKQTLEKYSGKDNTVAVLREHTHKLLSTIILTSKNQPTFSLVFSSMINYISSTYADDLHTYISPEFLLTAHISPRDLVPLTRYANAPKSDRCLDVLVMCTAELADLDNPVTAADHAAAALELIKNTQNPASVSDFRNLAVLVLALKATTVSQENLHLVQELAEYLPKSSNWYSLCLSHGNSIAQRLTAQGEKPIHELPDIPLLTKAFEYIQPESDDWIFLSPFRNCAHVSYLLSALTKDCITADLNPDNQILRESILINAVMATLICSPVRLKRALLLRLRDAISAPQSVKGQRSLPQKTTLTLFLLPYVPVFAGMSLIESARLIVALAYIPESASVLMNVFETILKKATFSLCTDLHHCEKCHIHRPDNISELWSWTTPEFCRALLTEEQFYAELGDGIRQLILDGILPINALISKLKNKRPMLLRFLSLLVEYEGPKIWTWFEKTCLQSALSSLPEDEVVPALKLIATLVSCGCIGKENCLWLLQGHLQIPQLLEVHNGSRICSCGICQNTSSDQLCISSIHAYMSLAAIIREYVQAVVLTADHPLEGFSACLTPYYMTCFDLGRSANTAMEHTLRLCGLYGVSSLISRSHHAALALMDVATYEGYLGEFLGAFEYPDKCFDQILSPSMLLALVCLRKTHTRECDVMYAELFAAHQAYFGIASRVSNTAARHPMLTLCYHFLSAKGRFVSEECLNIQKIIMYKPENSTAEQQKTEELYARRSAFLAIFKTALFTPFPHLVPLDLEIMVNCPGPQFAPESWELCIIRTIMFVHTILQPMIARYLASCPLAALNNEVQTLYRYFANRMYVKLKDDSDELIANDGPESIDPAMHLQTSVILIHSLASLALCAPTVQPEVVNLIGLYLRVKKPVMQAIPEESRQWLLAHSLIALSMLNEKSGGIERSTSLALERIDIGKSKIAQSCLNYLRRTFVESNAVLDSVASLRWYARMTEDDALSVQWKLLARAHLLEYGVDVPPIQSAHADVPESPTSFETWDWLHYTRNLRNSTSDDGDLLIKIRDQAVAAMRSPNEQSFVCDLGVGILLGINTYFPYKLVSLADPRDSFNWTTGPLLSTIGLAVSAKDKTPLGKAFLAAICDRQVPEVICYAALRNPNSILLASSLIQSFLCADVKMSLKNVINSTPPYNLVAGALNVLLQTQGTDRDLHIIFLLTNLLSRTSFNVDCSLKELVEALMKRVMDAHAVRESQRSIDDGDVDADDCFENVPIQHSDRTRVCLEPISVACVLSGIFAFAANVSIGDMTVANILFNLPLSGWWSKFDLPTKLNYVNKCVVSAAALFDPRSFTRNHIFILKDFLNQEGRSSDHTHNIWSKNSMCGNWSPAVMSVCVLLRQLTEVAIIGNCTGTASDSPEIQNGHLMTVSALVPPGWRPRLTKTWVTLRGPDQLVCGIREVNRIASHCYEKLYGVIKAIISILSPEVMSSLYSTSRSMNFPNPGPEPIERALALLLKACHQVDSGLQAKNLKNASNLVPILSTVTECKALVEPLPLMALIALDCLPASYMEITRQFLCRPPPNIETEVWVRLAHRFIQSLLILGDEEVKLTLLKSTVHGLVGYAPEYGNRIAELLWSITFEDQLYRISALHQSSASCIDQPICKLSDQDGSPLQTLRRWSLAHSIEIARYCGDKQFLELNSSYLKDIHETKNPLISDFYLKTAIYHKNCIRLEPSNQLIKTRQDEEHQNKATAYLRKFYRKRLVTVWTGQQIFDLTNLFTSRTLSMFCDRESNQHPELIAQLRIAYGH